MGHLMKKAIRLSLVSIALGTFFLLWRSSSQLPIGWFKKINNQNQLIETKELNFLYSNLQHPVSLSMFDAEMYSNYLVVAPMVGTLVVYFSDERPHPFLAKSWHVDGQRWEFEMREGLKCENGEPITAEGMKKSIIRSLRWLSKEHEQPVFNKLRGYKEFRATGQTKNLGIIVEGSKLIFEFAEKFRSGFLEYLSMVPFGFICDENFKGDKWADKTKFISSGPFRIVEYVPGSHYTLEKRKDWPLTPPETADRVVIRKGTIENLEPNRPATILETSKIPQKVPQGFNVIKQIPGALMTLSLSTHPGQIFHDKSLRQIFRAKVREKIKGRNLGSNAYTWAEHFYFQQTDKLDLPETLPQEIPKKLKSKIKVRSMPLPLDERTQIVEDVLTEALADLGWEYEIIRPAHFSWQDFLDTQKYDIRRVGAEIGGGFEGWGAEMLFCSKIGVKFADPSGRICALAKEYETTDLPIGEAIKRFNTYIEDDAGLIPLFHIGGQYLMSSDLDSDTLSPLITRV